MLLLSWPSPSAFIKCCMYTYFGGCINLANWLPFSSVSSMTLKENKKQRKPKHHLHVHYLWRLLAVLVIVLIFVALACYAFFLRGIGYAYNYNSSKTLQLHPPLISGQPETKSQASYQFNSSSSSLKAPKAGASASENGTANIPVESQPGPYHNWQLFAGDFQEMMTNFKIYVYPHVYNKNITIDPFAGIFIPHTNPFNPKLGNYLSEHMFKLALLRSSLITTIPQHARFFFLPFSVNNLRNDPRVRSEASIAEFVAQYTRSISNQFPFWNASGGADHFYVCCHSVGREAASRNAELHKNAIQVTCSSSYFQKFYVTHKDVALPQVWPRSHDVSLNPPHARHRLVYFAGRIQNSRIRQELIALWGNDTSIDIFQKSPFPYEEGFKRSKYCLHVKGYEVNTARVSDAIQYGCVPVILSNYYDLPFVNVLDWTKFSVIINHGEIASLKDKLLSITRQTYLSMYRDLCQVRRHFVWHKTPRGYDSFYMTAYQLWLRRSIHRLSY